MSARAPVPPGHFDGIRVNGVAYVSFCGAEGTGMYIRPLAHVGCAPFDWGRESEGAAELSLAILARYFEHVGLSRPLACQQALALHQEFMRRRVAGWTGDSWRLTTAEIVNDLAAITGVPHV